MSSLTMGCWRIIVDKSKLGIQTISPTLINHYLHLFTIFNPNQAHYLPSFTNINFVTNCQSRSAILIHCEPLLILTLHPVERTPSRTICPRACTPLRPLVKHAVDITRAGQMLVAGFLAKLCNSAYRCGSHYRGPPGLVHQVV